MAEQAKAHLNVVVLGHSKAGKSTAIGHMLYKLGEIDRRVWDRCDRDTRDAGRASMKFAWVLDRQCHEREAGCTTDLSVVKLETPKYSCTVIDVPGKPQYLKHMIAGTCQADCAVLVVDAEHGPFEEGMTQYKHVARTKDPRAQGQRLQRAEGQGERRQRRLQGQTREHAILAFYFGMRQLVVMVNKMDVDSVDWSQERFCDVKERVTKMLRGVGYDVGKVRFVPTSGWTGDCLVEGSSQHMSWYQGLSLLQALDELVPPPRLVEKPLRLPVSDVFKVGGIGSVPAGRVEYGLLKPGMRVRFEPLGLEAEVRSVEHHSETLQQAMAGDNVGLSIKGVAAGRLARGLVVSDPVREPAAPARSFTARIAVLHHPRGIRIGYCPVVDVHTAHVACRFTKLISRTPRGSKESFESPLELLPGDKAVVELTPCKPLCLEAYSEYPSLGCFAVRDVQTTVAVGQVLSVERAEAVQTEQQQGGEAAASNGNHNVQA